MAASILVRPWKRRDRSTVERWPAPNLPPHWAVGLPSPGRAVSWAIDRNGHLVGRITQRDELTIGPGFLPWDVGRISIYLHPAYYGQGIGTAALQRFLAMPQPGIDSFRLYVAEDNNRAIRCYEKCGFVQLARHGALLEMELIIAPDRAIADDSVSRAVC